MKFSIITPVYNRADCIARCIKSVINQVDNETEVEHIIVDDGSTDNTTKIIQKYASQYPHIHFIVLPHNCGTNAARNAAITVASGDFCIILDSDDYFVDDAILFMSSTIKQYGQYSHYMFAPDDMQTKYGNSLLLNTKQKIITYQDFLTGKVKGDFIHMVKSSILKKYPFDETLRIYEGVFFMRFYRESQNMLFSNRVVTIRERGRKDSATREAIRTNLNVIKRSIKASELFIEWFANDLRKFGYNNILNHHYLLLLENLLLIGNYVKAHNIILNTNGRVPAKLKMIYSFRLGFFYRKTLALYLWAKYSVFKSKVQ